MKKVKSTPIPATTLRKASRFWGAAVVTGILTAVIWVLGWYFYPLLCFYFSQTKLPATLSQTLAHPVSTPPKPTGLRQFVVGWFNAMQPVNRKVSVLVLGFDETGKKRPGRTDVILVAEIDPDKGIGIISVPRDLWVPVPVELAVDGQHLIAEQALAGVSTPPTEYTVDTDVMVDTDTGDREPSQTTMPVAEIYAADGRTYNRINAVYRLGNKYFGKGMGHVALKKVLSDELGLEIDYTVAIDYDGVKKVIDMLGGVTVDVQCPIQDNFVSLDSKAGYEALRLTAGRHRLSGHEALLFMRSRHGRTDIDRSRRQQKVLLALKNQLLDDSQFLALPKILSQMLAYVRTDAELPVALQLAATAKELGGGVHGMLLRTPMVDRKRSVDGKSVLVLNKEKYEEGRKSLYSQAMPGERGDRVCPRADAALNWREAKRKL